MKSLKGQGIISLGQNRYMLRVQPENPATGKRVNRKKTVECSSAHQAELLRLEFENEVIKELGEPLNFNVSNNETLKDYFDNSWLNHPTRNVREHVRARDKDVFRDFINPIIGSVKLCNFKNQHVIYWMNEVQKKKKKDNAFKVAFTGNESEYSRETFRRAWRVLRAMLVTAHQDGKIERPADYRFSPKAGKAPKKKESLTTDELFKIHQQAEKTKKLDIRTMLWLQISTGCRFGELTALEWSDIDFQRHQVTFSKSQTKGEVGATKTGLTKTVPLTPMVEGMLQKLKAEQEDKAKTIEKYTGKQVTPSAICFPSKRGTYRSPSLMNKILKKLAQEVGISKTIASHTLRRTFNDMTRLIADRLTVMSMTGHITEQMFEHYSNVSIEEKRKVVEKAFPALVSGEADQRLH